MQKGSRLAAFFCAKLRSLQDFGVTTSSYRSGTGEPGNCALQAVSLHKRRLKLPVNVGSKRPSAFTTGCHIFSLSG
ncbi:MAG: hypothetical protein JWP59_3623 [Massilia sp.]|jgi:hypothetical protein|nr:hypothetical protein [Massilia sp.]